MSGEPVEHPPATGGHKPSEPTDLGADPEPPRPDDDRRVVGVIETVLMHQVGATAVIGGALASTGAPGGGWNKFLGRLLANPEMALFPLGSGTFAGGLLTVVTLMLVRRFGFSLGWVGRPPLVWGLAATVISLTLGVWSLTLSVWIISFL